MGLQITIIAYDNQNPERTAQTTVIVDVEVDGSNPVFVPATSPVIYTIDETAPIGQILGTLTAVDSDLRGTIVYETNRDYPGINFFGVNSTTGQIYVMNNLMSDALATLQYTVSNVFSFLVI